MGVKCFWLEPTDMTEVGLRRWRYSREQPSCPREGGKWGHHGALVLLDRVRITWSGVRPENHSHWFSDGDGRFGVSDFEFPGHGDPRWPAACECGYEFTAEDPWQEWTDRLYQRADSGELTTLRAAAPGAMWDAVWYPEGWKGADGRSLIVKCPNGSEWVIDSRASNCTRPDDSAHRCWVRYGEPPVITVGKDGDTCAAGAGSIQAGDYHGFLRNGEFTG